MGNCRQCHLDLVRIAILTAGTGSYYCGACMRDNALARALIARGHEVNLVPLYLPLQLDEDQVDEELPVFFGGINVYLQSKYGFFRKIPRWIDRLWNGRGLLRFVAKRSHLTSAREQGEMTCEMLKLEESAGLEKETEKLLEWLEKEGKPEVLMLSNALLAGFTSVLKDRLGVPVVCTFQGEDSFLDGLPEPSRSEAWSEMGRRVRDVEVMVAPSRYYAGEMETRLGLESGEIEVIPNGVQVEDFERGSGGEGKRIGYLARLCELKGLGLLVEAFILMNDPSLELVVVGTLGGGDEKYVEGLKAKLEQAGLAEAVTWRPDLSKAEKVNFLASLTVFSVPVVYPEAFGLYLVEAMAAAVPVVMPRASAFPEIVEESGCGVLVESGSAEDLARGLREVLDDPRREEIGNKGRRAVEDRYNTEVMAKNFEQIFRKVVAR